MCSAQDNVALPTLGFPIRASAGHWPFSASPRLIAAVHALHRLLVPRHPPCALTILTVIGKSRRLPFKDNLTILSRSVLSFSLEILLLQSEDRSLHPDTQFHWLLCSFQGPQRGVSPPEARVVRRRAAGDEPVSQNSTACVQSACADWIGRNLPDRNGGLTVASGFLPTVFAARRTRQVRSTCLSFRPKPVV